MPQRPTDLPREPLRALAVFLALPLVVAAVGARNVSAPAPAAPYVGAALGAPIRVPLGPRDSLGRRAPSTRRAPDAR